MESNGMQANGGSAPEMNAFDRIIGVFTSPGKTFASIDVNPTWILPVLIIIAVSLLNVFLAGNIERQEQLDLQVKIMEDRGMDPEQIDEAMEMSQKLGSGIFYIILVPLRAVGGPLIVLLIVSAFFLFIGSVIMGGQTTFEKIWSVTAHSFLITSLYKLIILPIIMAKKTMFVTFSLASFMPEESKFSFFYFLLASVDIFLIWWIVAYSIGLGVIYKMKTQKMAVAVTSVYVIYAVSAAGLASLFL